MTSYDTGAYRKPRVGLVLAGGAARGAYEVGVVQYLLEDVSRAIGFDIPLDILCGTSVGAINVCALAASADVPAHIRAERLIRPWANLRIGEVLRPDAKEIFALVRGVFRRSSTAIDSRGAILDPSGLERVIRNSIDFNRIDANLMHGYIYGVTISTTQVSTGRTIIYIQRAKDEMPRWSRDVTIQPRVTKIRTHHALASAAIPLLFPAVKIDGEFYCDGGLRQNVPLSPARRLGANGLIVINPRHLVDGYEPTELSRARELAFPSPLFLIGKSLNALLLDRIDNDIDRLAMINSILDAGSARYGHGFVDEINAQMGRAPGHGIRPLAVVLIRASEDMGRMAAEFVQSSIFRNRTPAHLSWAIERLADGDAQQDADLLSYLLFDGEFARQLIALGRADARSRHDELCEFFLKVSTLNAANNDEM